MTNYAYAVTIRKNYRKAGGQNDKKEYSDEIESRFVRCRIAFPMTLLDKKYIAKKIKKEYNGKNSKELAKNMATPKEE